jgi:glucoamylase
MLYANNLTDSGYVSKYLWTADGKGAIPTDLDFVATIWNAQTCDLWEEIRSDDLFWNRMMQRAAMHQGTAFAKKMGDSARAAKYAQVAQQIDSSIMQHFNGNFVYEDQSRQKDSAVIEAFNKGYLNDGVFGPLSVEVAKTVQTLNTLFCTSYKINQNDTQAGVPGILYGRYEGDTYDGGNPWVLLSASLAELLYRAAADLLSGAKPTDDAFALWNDISGEESSNRDAKVLGTALLGAGDGVMTRIRHHIGDQMHMNEQIDRNTGALTSAKDLTWNYANILSAMLARSRVSELL